MVTPPTLAHDGDESEDRLQLVVVEGELVAAHDLPDSGILLLGRGDGVDVRLSDPGASARHARLQVVGGRITIEDLGSRNGTQVRGQRLASGEPAALAPGEAAMLGSAMVLVQRKNRRLQHRQSLPHGYFELRLAEECLLAQAFSIARLDLDSEGGDKTDAVLEAAAERLRPSDILGTYGPNAYEVLLPRTPPDEASRAVQALVERLRPIGANPRAALAHFPGDGRTAHALLEKASAGVRPAPAAPVVRPGVIVRDGRMQEVYRLAQKAASRDINVLVLGETGVGKEILAETLHKASKRADKPFLCLNCGALSETLRESELFGYERGAFTDAKTAKPGLLEAADGGTVFLDEIGEMSLSLQAMLLRAIESKQVTRIGGLKPKTIDVRFVSATHKDLIEEIRGKRFRSDLYYRLNGVTLEIPPLRERRAEIRPLADSFLAQLAPKDGGRTPRLGDDAAALLESYAWPGNIRELRNVMDRALLHAEGAVIEPDHISLEALESAASVSSSSSDDLFADPGGASAGEGRWTPGETEERTRVLEALRAEGGNQTRAARRLGISRNTLIARMERFDVPRPQKGRT